jgi:hypothetical protein
VTNKIEQMSYFLIFFFVCMVLLILAMWYHASAYNKIPDNQVLMLDTNENTALLFPEPSNIIDIDRGQLGVRALQQVYKISASINDVCLGTDLQHKYRSITGKNLQSSDIFYLRDTIGVNLEIAIVRDRQVHTAMERTMGDDSNSIGIVADLLERNQLNLAHNFITKLLADRWNKIRTSDHRMLEIEDPQDGSYLYVSNEPRGVQGYNMGNQVRINILCTDIEFATLHKRLFVKSGFIGHHGLEQDGSLIHDMVL